MNYNQIQKLTLLERLDNIKNLIEVADRRAMAVDGPVGHVRENLTDKEWRELYLCSVVPEHLRNQGKQLSNSKQLNKWMNERVKKGYSFTSIKGKVPGIYYKTGHLVNEVNIAWVCNETKEHFNLEWK